MRTWPVISRGTQTRDMQPGSKYRRIVERESGNKPVAKKSHSLFAGIIHDGIVGASRVTRSCTLKLRVCICSFRKYEFISPHTTEFHVSLRHCLFLRLRLEGLTATKGCVCTLARTYACTPCTHALTYLRTRV